MLAHIKLVDILVHPHLLNELSVRQQSQVVAEASYYNMLAQLRYLCQKQGIWDELSHKLKMHFESAELFYRNQRKMLTNEAEHIRNALEPLNIKWVHLKGAAYHLSEISGFSGRMMNDLDILVEESELPRVEQVLREQGWVPAEVSNYDDKFYRSWSQEIPPLRHIYRQVELDVHFNILPKTIKESLDGQHLFQQTEPLIEGYQERVLKPHAMLVHSAIHLFYESEYHKGLRDLYDIAVLVETYGEDDAFWHSLIDLQHKVGNEISIFYALRYSQRIYQADIPEFVTKYYDQFKPQMPYLWIADFCFEQVFIAMYPPHRRFGHGLAESFLYLRGHLKRMPLKLLIPHFFHKSLEKFKATEEAHELF